MSTAKSFLDKLQVVKESINEAAGRLVKKIVIRDGKREIITKREYSTECPDGYRRDEDGKCVRMSSQERRNRSLAALRASKKSSTKRNRAIGMKRRSTLIKD